MKESFRKYFHELIGVKEAEAFFEAIEAKELKRSLRVNTLKWSKERLREWLEASGYEVADSDFVSEGLDILGRGERLSLKLPYHAGFDYPQDSASMFAVEVLDPQPGERVIDLTAAPGGKSTHIAQRMQNSGVLFSCDHDVRRLKALHSNLERLGIWNTVVLKAVPFWLARNYGEYFDRVLLDPSCSGEGLLVTRDGKPGHWSPKSLKRYAAEQFGLLCSAFELLKPGGRLVYSTCTLNDVEDDGVVQRLLDKFEEAELVEIKGGPEQIGDFVGLRFWPHKTGTKGFYCVAISKKASLEREVEPPRRRLELVRKDGVYRDFLREKFGVEMENVVFSVKDEHLFVHSADMATVALPEYCSFSFPLLKLYKKDEWRPTHAGALYLGLVAKKGVVELDEEQVKAVFERQPIENDTGLEGLHLAKYGEFPLGVAKLDEKIEVVLPRQH